MASRREHRIAAPVAHQPERPWEIMTLGGLGPMALTLQ